MAKAWTTGSISRIVVEMPWAIRAVGVVPMPRPLKGRGGKYDGLGWGKTKENQAVSHYESIGFVVLKVDILLWNLD